MVRDTAVTALLELYADEDNVEPMHELTARFAPRFAQLIHDVDEGVAVKGVSCMHSLLPVSCHVTFCIFTSQLACKEFRPKARQSLSKEHGNTVPENTSCKLADIINIYGRLSLFDYQQDEFTLRMLLCKDQDTGAHAHGIAACSCSAYAVAVLASA